MNILKGLKRRNGVCDNTKKEYEKVKNTNFGPGLLGKLKCELECDKLKNSFLTNYLAIIDEDHMPDDHVPFDGVPYSPYGGVFPDAKF